MLFKVERSALIKPLQLVAGLVGGRPSQPIFNNVLIRVDENGLSLTTTDLEVEMVARVDTLLVENLGATTVPARKLLDICRGLPEAAQIQFALKNDRLHLSSGKGRYLLSVLPAADFPTIESWQNEIEFSIAHKALKGLIEASQFAMASQDVRYYLNGMLFEFCGGLLKAVATDGHRLALSQYALQQQVSDTQIIVPRKGVLEMLKLLDLGDELCSISVGENNIRVANSQVIFTCKLVDGRFPDYNRVIPRNIDKYLTVDKNELKQAFTRAAILSNEKFRGVRLLLSTNLLTITANNPEQEQAEELLDIEYQGGELEIGFNVSYILDVLNNYRGEQVTLCLGDSNSSALIEDKANYDALHVVMPMRL